MTPEHWEKISSVFFAALESQPAEIDAFLRDRCGTDRALYADVRRMWLERSRDGFLDESPWDSVPAPRFAPGVVLARRYRIVRFLNQGGMGEVYEADDLELKEPIALKTLLPALARDDRMIARFKQEIQLSRRIAHPNVCRTFDLVNDPDNSIYFLTMELICGETLAQHVRKEGPLAPAAALPLLSQVASALDAAHAIGIVHRDLKPSNVMLAPTAGGAKAVVTDFGLARNMNTSDMTATSPSHLLGSFDYMAPELFEGCQASASSDIYALGMIAKRVCQCEPSDTRKRNPAGLGARWRLAVRKATHVEPARRFARASDFTDALAGNRRSRFARFATERRGILTAIAISGALLIVFSQTLMRLRTPRASRMSPEAISLYRKGRENIQTGAFYAAMLAFRETLKAAPRFAPAHAGMAQAWAELQVPEDASREMLLARREDPQLLSERERIEIEAVDLTITREFAAAVSRYEALHKRWDDVELDMDLGRSYEEANRPADAISTYLHTIREHSPAPAAWLRLAVLYSRGGPREKADVAFQNARKGYEIGSNLEGLIQVSLERGLDANRNALFPEAGAYLRNALETARLSGNTEQQVAALLQLAGTAYRSGDALQAEQYARSAIELARNNQMELLAVDGLYRLGNAYRLKKSFAEAEKYYRDGLAIAARNGADRLTAVGNETIAALHDEMSRPAEALAEARQALSYFGQSGYTAEAALCLTLIGRNQRNQGDLEGAASSFHRLLQLSEKVGDRPGIARAHASLGSLAFRREDFPKALEEFTLEQNYADSTETKAYTSLWTGILLWKLGHYAEAQSAFDTASRTGDSFSALQASVRRSVAEMEISRGHFAAAETLARGALRESGEDLSDRAAAQRLLCMALIGEGARTPGLRNCTQSLESELKLGDPANIWEARVALLTAEAKIKDYAAAETVLGYLRGDMAGHPESKWKILALMARSNARYLPEAREALKNLFLVWKQDMRLYLARPDIESITRHLAPESTALLKERRP